MGASDTLPRPDPEATADLAAAALELDPDDWRLAHVTAHLRTQHPQVAAARTWPDDNPYTAHDTDHQQWNYDHTHRRGLAERFADLNPDFGVLPDDHDPAQHQFAADREQALALGTREFLMAARENQADPQGRRQTVTDRAASARTQALVHDASRRLVEQRTSDQPRPLPQRPAPERARGGPER
jgi:hypothetical protein